MYIGIANLTTKATHATKHTHNKSNKGNKTHKRTFEEVAVRDRAVAAHMAIPAHICAPQRRVVPHNRASAQHHTLPDVRRARHPYTVLTVSVALRVHEVAARDELRVGHEGVHPAVHDVAADGVVRAEILHACGVLILRI